MIGSHLKLNNGIAMPNFGLGVYQSRDEEALSAVTTALDSGYRLIDSAAAYLNEEQVGQAIRRSAVDRSDIFVTTKLWISDYGYDQALHAFDRSMRKLGLEQLDLYLLHWPVPAQFDKTIESWRAAERLLADGRVRAIGVCNFGTKDLDALMAESDVAPAVNQVELHPFFSQPELRAANQRHGIVTQAWSPIGGVKRYFGNPVASDDPLKHPVVTALAAKYDKTAAQIVLRWQVELGNAVIPKSVNAARIRENAAIFDFRLANDEVASINALNSGNRGGPDPEQVSTQQVNFTIPD
jgi:diketogulonate reductase-like aldo/keto reductase